MVLAGKSGEDDTFLPSLDQNKFKKRSRLWEFKELEKELSHYHFKHLEKSNLGWETLVSTCILYQSEEGILLQ